MRTRSPAAIDADIIWAQAELLDHSGHVHAHLSESQVRRRIGRINQLRAENGWEPLDMRDRR